MNTIINPDVAGILHEMAKFSDKPSHSVIMRNDNGSVNLVVLKRGQQLAEHLAPADAMVQVLQGSVDFTVKGETMRLAAGQFLLMAKGTSHSLAAPEDIKIVLTLIKP